MSGLRFAHPTLSELRAGLLADPDRECCAIAYARHEPAADAWVAFEAALVPDRSYEERGPTRASLSAALVAEVARRCREESCSAVLVHTHPRASGHPRFSDVDDVGEAEVAAYLARRGVGDAHLALVLGPEGCRARRLGGSAEVPVWEVGRVLSLASEPTGGRLADDRADRQVRAFGEHGQRVLGSLRVGVVGAGGTGSAVLQQLALLGVRDLVVIEPDFVEATNLNRLVGAGFGDVGVTKVSVAERMVRSIQPQARFVGMERDVVDEDVARVLAGLDFAFCCTDSHASRAVVGQLAYQHLVPTIDMGVSITVDATRVTHVTGRVQMLAPGLECLVCSGVLDYAAVAREMMTEEQVAADSYLVGASEPQPSVASLNATMASLAVTMFLGAVTPVPTAARFQVYDGLRGTVRPASATRDPRCVVCSPEGALARAGSWPLPTRPARGSAP